MAAAQIDLSTEKDGGLLKEIIKEGIQAAQIPARAKAKGTLRDFNASH